MRELIGTVVLANTVSMLISNREGAIWIADCDEDALFYERRCAHPQATVLPAAGQGHEVLLILKERGFEGVFATLQCSTDRLEADEFALSSGDVTSFLVFSESCLRILQELGGRVWITASESNTSGFMQRAILISYALKIAREAMGINRKDRVQSEEILDRIVDWQRFEIKKFEEIAEVGLRVFEAINEQVVDRSVICGDDLLVVLSNALAKYRPRGIASASKPNAEELLRDLMIGYEIKEFEDEQMFWDLRAWQRTNGFPALRDWRVLDALGALLDQRYWESDLKRFLSINGDAQLAGFKMDLDNFKQVNEVLGHMGGDEAIRLYCTVVSKEIGDVAEIYRRGGDEVVAIAPYLSAEQARVRAASLLRAIQHEFKGWAESKGIPVQPTASIGLVVFTARQEYGGIVAALDEAQLRAKRNGKNRVEEIQIQ